jgi:nucleotide-binding universal stress UspA family protein
MLKHVLVPLDGSSLAEGVLPHAVAIAKAFDARLTLLNILEQPAASLRMPKADPLDWYLKRTEATTYLTEVQTRLEKSHLLVEIMLREGHATEQIVEVVHTSDVDLLVLNSHGEHDANGWFVSSTVQQLLQRIWTSTLIIHMNQSFTAEPVELQYQRLVLPLDGSRRAAVALPIATALAKAHQAELLLVRVVSKPEMARYMPLTLEDEDLMNRVVERNEEEGSKYLDQLRAHSPANVHTRLLVSDNVAATLQSFCEQAQTDLLIMSAHGYSGEAKWPYGSVTNRFITDGTMPLLIVQDQPHASSDTAEDDVITAQIAH